MKDEYRRNRILKLQSMMSNLTWGQRKAAINEIFALIQEPAEQKGFDVKAYQRQWAIAQQQANPYAMLGAQQAFLMANIGQMPIGTQPGMLSAGFDILGALGFRR